MIPERAGVRRRNPVCEGLSGLDRTLHDLRAIHRRRNSQAMPVNHRRFGEPVRELDFQRDALVRFENGTGPVAGESVAAERLTDRSFNDKRIICVFHAA